MSEMLATESISPSTVGAERRTVAVMVLTFLPWLAVVLFTAGVWAAVHLLVYGLVVLAVGYGIVNLALPASFRPLSILFAPALGILVGSAVTALWLRLGFSLVWSPILWLVLIAAGLPALWADRSLWAAHSVSYGWTLAFFSLIICAVYFLPTARNDAVLRRDGSFNWIYVDTQYFNSIAAGIERGDSPPRAPGSADTLLFYHFAPYAPAAAMARLTGIPLNDAFARVTRGASLWALVLSCFSLGTLLSIKATGQTFGGIMSVAGLFFYGSLMSLFTDQPNSSSHVTGPLLFSIPGMNVVADGGPFAHLILGHSVLHGLGALTAIMALCLVRIEQDRSLAWRGPLFVALPALAVPVNSVSALYSLGIVGVLLFWGRLQKLQSWLWIMLMLALFFVAWRVMGYSQAPDLAHLILNRQAASQWPMLAIWFTYGLGFRILGFRWISSSLKDRMSALVVASGVGLLAFSLSLQLDGNERYGVYFLQSMLSIFAFSRLTTKSWRSTERSEWAREWLKLTCKGLLILASAGVLVGIVLLAVHRHTGIPSFGKKLVLCLLVVSLMACVTHLMRRSEAAATILSAALMAVLLVGFAAWISPWLNYALGRAQRDITLSPGEVKGLSRVRELAATNERFATNKHAASGLATNRERSYAYGTLAERPVLLEGYLDHGLTSMPGFSDLLRNNDLMFTTNDPETLHKIASTYRVQWLIARPGTDISLSRPLPAWLTEEQNTGSLKIYKVN